MVSPPSYISICARKQKGLFSNMGEKTAGEGDKHYKNKNQEGKGLNNPYTPTQPNTGVSTHGQAPVIPPLMLLLLLPAIQYNSNRASTRQVSLQFSCPSLSAVATSAFSVSYWQLNFVVLT